MTDWTRVTKDHPCQVCWKNDWCGYTDTAACCMRISSIHPAHNGGWIHRLSDPIPHPTRIEPPKDHLIRPCFESTWRNWRTCTEPVQIDNLARHLGVSTQSLDDIGTAWAWPHSSWAFPMHDGAGKIEGIRLRDSAGHKFAVKGSKQGIFMPKTWPTSPDVALICEGPTDTAAALTLGFLALGRPSCVGCEQEISAAIKLMGIRRVVVVADNDPIKANGLRPGIEGARKLAAGLRVPNKTILPPGKDLREWVKQGATHELVDFFINQQLWRIP